MVRAECSSPKERGKGGHQLRLQTSIENTGPKRERERESAKTSAY